MPAQQPSLSTRARWIIRTQLAAVSPARRHTPGIHTRATGFLPFTGPARDAVAAAFREARRDGHRHWTPGHLLLGLIGTDHLLLALFRADDQSAAQALTRLGTGESQVRDAITALQAESGPERSA